MEQFEYDEIDGTEYFVGNGHTDVAYTKEQSTATTDRAFAEPSDAVLFMLSACNNVKVRMTTECIKTSAGYHPMFVGPTSHMNAAFGDCDQIIISPI